jgi:hypothetical protein
MTYENSSLRCRNCKFWWPLADKQPDTNLRQHASRGQCGRHAPPPVSADQEWAIVRSDDWCGEHSHVISA